MNILSWNVRVAGGTVFTRVFKNTYLSHKPDLVILTETRLSGERANTVINSLGFERSYKVDPMGFSGGIWILWNPHNITVEPHSTSFFEVHLQIQVSYNIFILTALYASPKFNIRKNLWHKLSNIASFISLPWLLMGDFNEISHPREKFGGRPANRVKCNALMIFLIKQISLTLVL